MKRTAPALFLLVLWVAVLAVFTAFASSRLSIGTDLRLFLPSPTTANERLLLEAIGEGPASRVLVIVLDGVSPERLADVSRALVAELHDNELFRFVANGELPFDEFPDELLPYRFLLTPTLDTHLLRPGLLARGARGSCARSRLTGRLVRRILARARPNTRASEGPRALGTDRRCAPHFDVWFDVAGRRALLVAETLAPAFDPRPNARR